MHNTPLRIGFVGDCISAKFFYEAVKTDNSIICEQRLFGSFEPFLRFDKSAINPNTGRFIDPELDCFVSNHHFFFPPMHQISPDSISPKPDMVITNLGVEPFNYLLKHQSGISFIFNEKHFASNRRIGFPSQQWHFIKEPLDPEQYSQQTREGFNRLAKAYHPAPIVMLLSAYRSADLFRALCSSVLRHRFPVENPQEYNTLLRDLCRENENIILLEIDRIVIDGVLRRGMAPEYYYPFVISSPQFSRLTRRDLIHPAKCTYHRLFERIKQYYQDRRVIEMNEMRFIEPPVSDEELRLAARMLPIVISKEQIRHMIENGDENDFLYALTQANFYDDGRFNELLIRRLLADETLHNNPLLTDSMFDYILKNPTLDFLPYIAVLLEEYTDKIMKDAYFHLEWLFSKLKEIRRHLFSKYGIMEKKMERFPAHGTQREYWEQLDKRLRFHRARRIAIFLAGQHTRRLLPFLRETGRYEIVALLDEAAGEGAEIDGVPILPPDRLAQLNVDAVVVSSDSIEEKLYRQFLDRYRTDPDLPVLKIYN